MKIYHSISNYFSVDAQQMADIFELYTSGESFEFISEKYKLHIQTVKNYISKYFYGLIPKHRQKVITLQSSINEQL